MAGLQKYGLPIQHVSLFTWMPIFPLSLTLISSFSIGIGECRKVRAIFCVTDFKLKIRCWLSPDLIRL
jgi:hypothetical protein